MRPVLLAAMAAMTLSAAAIRGVILDHQTGRPLARATVVAQPIAGTQGIPRTVRSAADGAFEFPELAGGAWLVIGSRRGFAPTQTVANAGEAGLTIRMRRFGAITGTVLDENDVGLQEHEVVAYRNARPLVIAARAKTDDRGTYRLDGLEPGKYLVRTVGRVYDEGSYLSTFAREALLLHDAQSVTVRYDDEIPLVDLRPLPGRFFPITGVVLGRTPAVVTLISDVGVQTATVERGGGFRFPPMPVGRYEIYAAAGRNEADWQRFELYDGSSRPRLTLAPFPELQLAIEDTEGKPVDRLSAPILIRRRDLTGESQPELFRGESRALAPGRWELSLAPTPSWYAVSSSGWTEVVLTAPGPSVAKFVLSNRPATIRGVVRDPAREPVAGVPVHLDGLRTVRADNRGEFEFYGLAPGAYRLIATFDPPTLGGGSPTAVSLREGEERSIDLVLSTAK
jgi:hypothetical protein